MYECSDIGSLNETDINGTYLGSVSALLVCLYCWFGNGAFRSEVPFAPFAVESPPVGAVLGWSALFWGLGFIS